MHTIVSENYHKNPQFLIFSMNFPNFIRNRLYEIFSFIRKYVHFLFNHVITMFVCLSLYLCFFKKNSILYHIVCNPQFNHADFRWKYSVISYNVSTFPFNWILILFLCLSLDFRFFSKNLQFYTLFPVINFIIHILMKIFSSLQKCLHFLFLNYILIISICLLWYVTIF